MPRVQNSGVPVRFHFVPHAPVEFRDLNRRLGGMVVRILGIRFEATPKPSAAREREVPAAVSTGAPLSMGRRRPHHIAGMKLSSTSNRTLI